MSLWLLGGYYDYLPSYLVSGVDLVFGDRLHERSSETERNLRNDSIFEITQFSIATLAYVGIFHLAPSLGYTIPQPVLLAVGLIFPEEATVVIQARAGIKSIREAVIQGRAGNIVETAKAVAMTAVVYFSTTARFYEFKDKFYELITPYVKAR